MNGTFLYPGGSATRNMSASSSPMSTLSSNYRGAGSSYTTETNTTYMSGAGKMDVSSCVAKNSDKISRCYLSSSFSLLVGSSRRQEMIGGGLHTTEVIMRKRSENRGYTDENIRDSIVMGDVLSKFPDLGKR